MTAPSQINIEQLSEDIATQNDQQFAFLLGAGCSLSSGVPTARSLAQHWLRTMTNGQRAQLGGRTDPDRHYGDIFFARFTTDKARRTEIMNLTRDARPGAGYAAMARLIASSPAKFPLTLTTNFDNLVETAMLMHTNVVPTTIPDPSLIKYLDLNDIHSIVKLHGDFRYNPKNNPSDIVFESEMIETLVAALDGKHLVICGYAGRDQNIVDLISLLQKKGALTGVTYLGASYPLGFEQTDIEAVYVNHCDFDDVMFRLAMAHRRCPVKAMGPKFALPNSHYTSGKISSCYEYLFSAMGLFPYTKTINKKLAEFVKEHYKDYMSVFGSIALELRAGNDAAATRLLMVALGDYGKDPNFLGYAAHYHKDVTAQRAQSYRLFIQTTDIDEENAWAWGNLALLVKEGTLPDDRNSVDEINRFLQNALSIDSSSVNNKLNAAGIYLGTNEYVDEGRELFRWCARRCLTDRQRLEALFYGYAHGEPFFNVNDDPDTYLDEIRTMIAEGVRSPSFSFDWNLHRAIQQRPDRETELRKLAASITNRPAPSP